MLTKIVDVGRGDSVYARMRLIAKDYALKGHWKGFLNKFQDDLA